MIVTAVTGILCAIGFVGTIRAIKMSNTDVIAIGYTTLKTGTDILITEFNPWFARIKLIIVKITANTLYDTLGTILWKYSDTDTIKPHAVVKQASATIIPNTYLPSEPKPVVAMVVNRYVPIF